MKLLIFFMLTAASPTAVDINDSDFTYVLVQDNKKEISVQELPEAVVTAVKDSEYGDWTVGKVYLFEGDAPVYELHLFQGDEVLVLLSDADGNLQPKTEG